MAGTERMINRHSIRHRLLVSLLGMLLASLLLGAYATYQLAHEEASESFDYQLRQIALSLRGGNFTAAVAASDPEEDSDFIVQVYDIAGKPLYHSSAQYRLPPPRRSGYDRFTYDGMLWRVFSEQHNGLLVEVAQSERDREELAATAALRAVSPFLVLLPLIGIAVWILVGRGLAPLSLLTSGIQIRRADDLSPLPADDVPLEVLPLTHALNDLLARLGEAFSAQRAFVADAAHELRTPLAALTLQLQLAERAGSDSARREALTEVRAGLQRATHVVEQLLTLARNEPGSESRAFQPVNLAALVRTVTAKHVVLADSKHIDMGVVRADDGAVVQGDEVALASLLSNLVENALRYTPLGGRVDIETGTGPNGCWVTVADNGPGIPDEEKERVFDRFYRQLGTRESGSGLGLAIIRSIAQRHGAQVHLLDNPGGGLLVRVSFPAS